MKAAPFFYKCGTVETTIPWYPPDPVFLNQWRDEFFSIPGVRAFDYWLCGAAMETWYTNDVDVIMTGEIGDLETLEFILTAAMTIGFKHRQLIDIAWNDYYKKYLEKGRCERRAICCEHFFDHGWCTINECTALATDIVTIVVGNEVIKNGAVLTPFDPTAIRLRNELWQITMASPSQKQIERMKSGRVYHSSPCLITPELDFKEVVPWP